jgi:hypothetical protein
MKDDQDLFDKAGEYLTHIGNVIGQEDFQNHLERAGSIAALISLPFKEKIDDFERKNNLLNHLEYTGTLIYMSPGILIIHDLNVGLCE